MTDLIGHRTLPVLLAEHAELRPGKPALVVEDREGAVSTLTYAQLADRVARAAGGFAAQGMGPGDKVVVHLANCAETVVTFFALAHLGAVAVPSNLANTAAEL